MVRVNKIDLRIISVLTLHKVVRNKKSKFFSRRYLIEFYEINRMSHVLHLYDVVNLLK